MDNRLKQLTSWVNTFWPDAIITVASADASFRRYFRISFNSDEKSYIAMDAPPEKEDCSPFIDITHRLLNANVHAPNIIESDLSQGFLILEDLGSIAYLDALTTDSADTLFIDKLYKVAIDELIKLQLADTTNLPIYNSQLLATEMDLMPDWFLKKHLKLSLTPVQENIINSSFNVITQNVLEQPQCFVHRDYHSRNIMQIDNDKPGIIDYQDAVLGSCTYDLVSLLRDCYIEWPEQRIDEWLRYYLTHSKQNLTVEFETFKRWFDFMGIQRHIKILGIFARLNHRDNKPNYLNDLPLTLKYFLGVARRYPELSDLCQLFDNWNIEAKINSAIHLNTQ